MCILCELAAAGSSAGSTNQSKVSLSLTDAAQKLLQFNASWSNGSGQATEVTYGFRASAPAYNNQVHNQQSTFSKVALQEMEAIRLALKGWSDVANLKFIEVNPGGYTDNAVMLFGNYVSTTDGANGFATPPSNNKNSSFSSQEGDVWLNDSKGKFQNVQLGEYDFKTIAHEIGHALGISHPGNYNGGPDVKITYESNAEFREDTRQYSIMSYFNASTLGANHGSEYSLTPLMLDIIAIQKLYGRNDQASSADSIYGYNSNRGALYSFSSTDSNIFCIWDSAGNDTLDASCFGTNQNISLVEGTFSNIGAYTQNISIAPGAVIESAIGGSGNDTILGNAANNRLYGNFGSDVITGGAGNDEINGGSGIDTAVFSGSLSQYSFSGKGSSVTVMDNFKNIILTDVISKLESDGYFFNPANGNFYKYYNYAVDWSTARNTSLMEKLPTFDVTGHLATFESSGEQNFIASKMAGQWNSYALFPWIGAELIDGRWLWVDGPGGGKLASGISWSVGQPDNYKGRETKAMWWWNSGINDGFAPSKLPYLVEFEAGFFGKFEIPRDGNDNIIDVEFLRFSDQTISTNLLPTYSVAASSTSVNEGSIAVFMLTTENVSIGTQVPYTLSGVSALDIQGGSLTGTVTVGSNGQAAINIALMTDNLTEGVETLTVTAAGKTASTLINDTSAGIPTYVLSTGTSSLNEGSVVTYTLTTTSVAVGVKVPYVLSGISALDVQGGSLSGTATIGSNGQATISVDILADGVTEGTETLTVTAAGKTALITINDTSKGLYSNFNGTNGNDIIRISSGSNSGDGGAGSDTVQYQTARSAASVVHSNGIITITKAGGTDRIAGIERIDFTDGDLIFDVASANAPAAYRLYGGAFARTPDEGGFRFWASTLDANVSLRDVATQFIGSGEFIGRYGASLSNAAFVDALYQNVLSRGGDAGGVAHWNRMLDNKFQDRSDILVQFTQLPEFVGISAANTTNGYWVV